MSDIMTAKDLNLWYDKTQALKNVNITIPEKSITAFIGPSGCGKSTFLKTLNRMNDLVDNVRIERTRLIDAENIYKASAKGTNAKGQYGIRIYGGKVQSGQKIYARAYAYYGDTIVYGDKLIEAEF